MKVLHIFLLVLVGAFSSSGEIIGELQTERFGMPVLCVGSNIYAAGGHSNRGIIGEIEQIYTDGSTTQLPCQVVARYFNFGAASSNRICLLGGITRGASCSASSCNVFESFDPQSRTVRYLSPMPIAVERAGAVIYSNRLFVIGGSTREGTRLCDVQIYDFASDTWSKGAAMPVAREGNVSLYNDQILVHGGYDGTSALCDFQVYHINENRWDKRPDLPVKMSAHQGIVKGDYLYTFGDYEYLDRVAVCDLQSNTWSLIDVNYQPARHQGAVVVDDNVFIVGGNIAPHSPYLNSIQKFSFGELEAAPRKEWLPGQEEKPKLPVFKTSRRSVNTFELVGRKAPAFSIEQMDEKTFDVATHTGQVVVLDFWSTGCGPCRRALPHMAELSEKMKDMPVSIVGIALDNESGRERVETLLNDSNVEYPVALSGRPVARDYYVSGIPCVVLIDTNGVVQGRIVGFSPGTEAALQKAVEQLLNGEDILDTNSTENIRIPAQPGIRANKVPQERVNREYKPDESVFEEKWRIPLKPPGHWLQTGLTMGRFQWQIPQKWLTYRNGDAVSVYRTEDGAFMQTFQLDRAKRHVGFGDSIDGAFYLRNGDSGTLVIRIRHYDAEADSNGLRSFRPVGYELLAINAQGKEQWGKKVVRSEFGFGAVHTLPVSEQKDWLLIDAYDKTVILDENGKAILEEKANDAMYGTKILRPAADGNGVELLVVDLKIVCYGLIPDQ